MKIDYSIVYSDRKTLSIIVERDRTVVVRAPRNTSPERIAREIETRKRLIVQKIEHNQKYPFEKQVKEFVSGESLLYLGKPYKLYVVDEAIDGVLFDSKFFLSKTNQKNAGVLLKDWYIRSASEIIIPKATYLAKQTGVKFNNINILDLKYRWGSCTPKDNIHFNWRLIKAPMTVIEYIIVHELTHLLETNHTPEFWNRVKAAYPLYPSSKKWLEKYGYELEIDF
ncbi:MAG TPA: SprT family zinc-dependent metalloprotease [Pyrinomonadaceae bacterium]|jgi:predicted metal-dependent hydrolase|nr:SprT family zinc-dependent metalloprotease [Pyrinomonadaceae bacterium]